MTLIIKKPTTSKLVMAKSYVGTDDPDAATYIAAVEAADGQALETATRVAIHSFVKGCKADGIWPAIKASCILAGARTLAGALVPLVGAAPTNVGPFVADDYNRKTGLVGNGSTKYLNTNRRSNADPQDSFHFSINLSHAGTPSTNRWHFGIRYISQASDYGDVISLDDNKLAIRVRSERTTAINLFASPAGNQAGFIAASREAPNTARFRRAGNTTSAINDPTYISRTPSSDFWNVHRVEGSGFSDARIAFYSIGESLDLALLDARVTDLINAIGAAF